MGTSELHDLKSPGARVKRIPGTGDRFRKGQGGGRGHKGQKLGPAVVSGPALKVAKCRYATCPSAGFSPVFKKIIAIDLSQLNRFADRDVVTREAHCWPHG